MNLPWKFGVIFLWILWFGSLPCSFPPPTKRPCLEPCEAPWASPSSDPSTFPPAYSMSPPCLVAKYHAADFFCRIDALSACAFVSRLITEYSWLSCPSSYQCICCWDTAHVLSGPTCCWPKPGIRIAGRIYFLTHPQVLTPGFWSGRSEGGPPHLRFHPAP